MLYTWQAKRRRSNVQIMAEILRVSLLREAGKTEISSAVNINHFQMQKYLKRLLELSLLDAVVANNRQISYRTTEKGKKLLSQIESAQELLQSNRPLNSPLHDSQVSS